MRSCNIFCLMIMIVVVLDVFNEINCQNIVITVNCTFITGSQMNCRDYCSTYFKSQPQLAWYNITTHQCQPLLICSWPLHYYNYNTNQCYTDTTMKQIAPSQYPISLIQSAIATFYIDNICVNGESQTGNFNDASCYCYQLWKDSGMVDINGYPFKCDQVIGPEQWKKYYINNLVISDSIKENNSVVVMYGEYTLQQLQVVYEQLLQLQHTQTLNFITKYYSPILNIIYKQLPQQNIIRQNEIIYLILIIIVIYVIFTFSYLTQQAQIIKVNKKQLRQRIYQIIINQNDAVIVM